MTWEAQDGFYAEKHKEKKTSLLSIEYINMEDTLWQ